MGTAGISTGTLENKENQATPVSSSSIALGGIVVTDPYTGLPQTNFVTDQNGELAIQVSSSSGQTQVAVNIGGENYLVDLDQVSASTSPSTPEIVFDYVDFDTPSTNYQSTATLTPNFSGLTPTGPVTWTIVGVVNNAPPGGWWKRGPTDQNGLTWGPTANGTNTWTTNAVLGTPPTGPVAQLTDIVGVRTVTVNASTVIAGTTYSRTLAVTFGNGPLTAFTGTFPMGPWASAAAGPTFTTSATFMALGCSGSVNSNVLGLPPTYPAAFWSTEVVGGDTLGYALPSKLATRQQLLAVAGYNFAFNSGIPRKGAALAAGLPYDRTLSSHRYSTGSVFYSAPSFYAVEVDLETGQESWSALVTDMDPNGACIN
jgi:hypothetical protein